MNSKLTKRTVENQVPLNRPFFVWDAGDGAVKGFGVSVHPTGKRVFVAQFRIGSGRAAKSKRVTIGQFGTWTVEQARERARSLIREGNEGIDRQALTEEEAATAAAERAEAERVRLEARALRFDRLAARFLRDHLRAKRKVKTIEAYRSIILKYLLPEFGKLDARAIRRNDVQKLHLRLRAHPVTANRVAAVMSSIYGWADRAQLASEPISNPTDKLEKYREVAKERFLSTDELRRLGDAIRVAETVGVPWEPDPTKKAKHAPKPENRRAFVDADAATALRLLIFTGARLREILHLKWEAVDLERGLLRLRDSKTGPKVIVLNGPARALLANREARGAFVFPGEGRDGSEQPRADLKRPWKLVCQVAGLEGLRIHDLRHSFASVGAAEGHGLVVVGKLLGHSQAKTTERYAHLADDPLRQASDKIAESIAAAMGEKSVEREDNVVDLRQASGR